MKFHPNIFIVNDDYHFVIITKKPSQVVLKIGRKTYYENNGGILPVLSPVHRFIIPQKVLDKAGRYEVSVRQVVENHLLELRFALINISIHAAGCLHVYIDSRMN